MPQEQPPPGTPCVVESCEEPASVYIDVAGEDDLEQDRAVPMCDAHAAHWRDAD